MLNTFVVYVEDKPGVLARVAILFRRRAFNIETLTVGRTGVRWAVCFLRAARSTRGTCSSSRATLRM